MRFLTKPRKNGIWIAVGTVVLGCGVMALVGYLLLAHTLTGLGEWIGSTGECVSTTALPDEVERWSNLLLPPSYGTLSVRSVTTVARECDVSFNMNARDWDTFVATNGLALSPKDGADIQLPLVWPGIRIDWAFDADVTYLYGRMSKREELTTVIVDTRRSDVYRVYVHPWLM